MSDIVLTAAVRQNLLSLQDTAALLSTTQGRLASGKKVNSALDNPTNFFTAAGLDARASDISNLLDSIGNGVQILQAADTGITSLSKLVDTAKSIANQALQTTVGYSTKANITSGAITSGGFAVGSNDLRGLGTVTNTVIQGTTVNVGAATGTLTAATALSAIGTGPGTASGNVLANGDSLTINGKTITFNTTNITTTLPSSTDAFGNVTFFLGNATATAPKVSDLLTAIDAASGNTGTGAGATAVLNSGAAGSALTLNTGVNSDFTLAGTGGAAAKLGLTAFDNKTTNRTGDTLTFASLGGGLATTVTFGDGTGGTVKNLNDLNAQLVGDNLTASIDSGGHLSISTTNDFASFSLPTVGGTAQAGGAAPNDVNGAFQASKGAASVATPIKDASSQATRQNLVGQYNQIITQITTTAQDASFNGIDLLDGNSLKLIFDETGKSTLTITGVTFNAGGLGLGNLVPGTDFIDNAHTSQVLSVLNNASATLRAQASAFGANLSIVQVRQDFSKKLINVLQTGSSNLTLADSNEEAANSQALSTRQSIAVSALSLANQSQQSVLQLLR
jgi:flagellin